MENKESMKIVIKPALKPQLFATSWLGLGFAETPITADRRKIKDSPKLPLATYFIREMLCAKDYRKLGGKAHGR